MALHPPKPTGPARVEAIECEACKKLHRATNSGWLVLYGRWKPGVESNRSSDRGKLFGQEHLPIVVCDNDDCLLRAMGRKDTDRF